MTLKGFLQVFGIIAVLMTLIPLIAADFWWIRIFDYLHIQLTLLTLTAIAAYFIRFDIKRVEDYVFMVVLLGCFFFQVIKIYPYFPHDNYEVGEVSEENFTNKFSLYAANVLQKNKNPKKLIADIKKQNPDVLLFTETNTRWKEDLSVITDTYPYKIEVPLDNTYGMLFYSRLKLKKPRISYLVDDSIPSIHSVLELRSGKDIMFHAIHPTPPMPQHNPSSTARDAEMMKIAFMAKDSRLPVVVAGDFNDVAWSATTALFQNVGGLLNTRVGRGFYNSFDATSSIMRWSLDHIFVTEEFRVADFKLGSDIDSDHFPIYIELNLEPDKAEEQKPKPPTKEELKDAREQIRNLEEKAKEELKKKN
ncbi:endonuclease/exonuclease/phosphatase (EEP) superfamily protein YafD [Salegentibacter sp. 24]|uniref:endonuclease/exonuclease/phosphatase family protein n=1 Tax=Salegentibacter sp. 24 TaxID=2183986 RepID=UPI00105F32BA|nr:endonuclease/exonuclease/phosphatase family protein [Salegentibacter sp. 24]TDN89312.1 endonuclease/exonuclease/phosphatase (EEP) superfamily protein YafD [Salegentibacter sp. 24]